MKIRNLIEGLQILAKYEPKGLDTFINGADHDVIWGTEAVIDYDNITTDEDDEEEYVDSRISAEDHARLRELGWFISEEYGETWSAYV